MTHRGVTCAKYYRWYQCFLCTKCTMSITRHSLITYNPQVWIQLVPNHSSSTVLTFVQLQLLLLIFKLVISVQLFLTNARICKCDYLYLYLYRVTSRFMPHHPGPDLVIPNCNNLPRDSISINKDFGWCAWGSVNILANVTKTIIPIKLSILALPKNAKRTHSVHQ